MRFVDRDQAPFTEPGALTAEQLKREAYCFVGAIFDLFAKLEMNLALFVARASSCTHFDQAIAWQEEVYFNEKLQVLLDAIGAHYKHDIDGYSRWAEWYMAADALRELRNRLAHCRWGYILHEQRVASVAGLPGSPNQNEIRYSLEELAAEVAEAERVCDEFSRLTRCVSFL